VQTAGNHEVEHQVKVALEIEDDTLPQAPKAGDAPSLSGFDRRIERPQEKRAREPHAKEWLSDYAGRERRQIREDVGELGHGRR
jgi:hypothetical protein